MAASTSLGILISMRVKIGYDRFYEARGHLAKFQGTAKNILRLLYVVSSKESLPTYSTHFGEIVSRLHTALCDYSNKEKLSVGKVLKVFSKEMFEEIQLSKLDLRIYIQLESEISTLNRAIYDLLKIRYSPIPTFYDNIINYLVYAISFSIPLLVNHQGIALFSSFFHVLIYQAIAFYNKQTIVPFGRRKYDIHVADLLKDVADEIEALSSPENSDKIFDLNSQKKSA